MFYYVQHNVASLSVKQSGRLGSAIIIACALTALPMAAHAQAKMTLDECRQRAIEHNIALRNADRDIAMATQQQREAFTAYFPSISASGATMKMSEDVMGLIDGFTYGGVMATQPVFAGGQIVNSNKLAAVGLEASRIQREHTAQEVALKAENYFWQVVTLEAKLATIDRIAVMLDRLESDVKAAVDAGVTLRNDLLEVQLRLGDVASKRLAVVNGISVGRMLLAQYIGCDTLGLAIDGGLQPGELPPFPIELKCDHQSALCSTPEYRLLEKNVEATKLQRRIEVGKNMPSIGVGASYSYTNIMDNDYDHGAVFATVKVPLSGWWGGSHAIKRKRLAEQTARETMQDNAQLLLIAMQNAWNGVEQTYKQLAIANQSIAQAEENLRLNDDGYRAGTTTMSNLLDAQQLYQQAVDAYVDAFAAYETKITEYRQATAQD